MGAMFIGQQFLQNVLGYSTLAGRPRRSCPPPFCMVLVAPRSAKIVEARGARFTLLIGYVFVLLGFLTMLLLWKEDISVLEGRARLRTRRDRRRARRHTRVALAHRLGAGPARRDGVGHRRPPARPRRRDHAVDLRRAPHRGLRDRRGSAISSSGKDVSAEHAGRADEVVLERRGHGSEQYPSSIQDSIVAGAKTSFLQGDQWAYTAGIVAVLLGAVLVFFCFPKADESRSCSPDTTPRTWAGEVLSCRGGFATSPTWDEAQR